MAASYPVGGYSPGAFSFQAATPVAVPATLAASGNWQSGVIAAVGYTSIAVSAQLSQTGQLSIQRYIDSAGTIPIGAAVTQALTANTVAAASVSDGTPWGSFIVTISNSSGSTGNLSNVIVRLSAWQF